jgi:putative OPT family oligopeptide transporter
MDTDAPIPQKPPEIRELTVRSVLCGLLVAAIMGASYPYIVLKLGFGPNVSVVSAFFGYLALGIVFKDYNRWENNMVQTAGTAAAQTAFMCILLAAFDMLAASPTSGFHITLSPIQAFWWLSTGGLLGVLLAIPMRQHFVVDERLPFPDGTAAGTTLIVLDAGDTGAKRAARVLAIGAIASAALMLMTEDARVLSWFPSVTLVGSAMLATTGVGVNWSLLSLGSGMIIGLRVDASMLLGATLSWVVAPYALLHYGIIKPGFTKTDVLFWIMWPATGMLVAAGLAGLFIRWGVLKKTFRNLSGASADTGTVPMKWVGIGVAVTSVALIVIIKAIFGVAIWITALSIILSVPLMLVGLRARRNELGTDQRPRQPDAGRVRRTCARSNDREHGGKRHNRYHRHRLRGADARLSRGVHDRLDAQEHGDHAAHRDAGRCGGRGVDVSVVAEHLRDCRQQRGVVVADVASLGRVR